MKALFIPLKREYFDAFKSGNKKYEYRRYGARWNERTCIVGREVTLSLGYGKAERLTGKIVSFEKCNACADATAWEAVYGKNAGAAAQIGIELIK